MVKKLLAKLQKPHQHTLTDVVGHITEGRTINLSLTVYEHGETGELLIPGPDQVVINRIVYHSCRYCRACGKYECGR